MYPAQPRPYTTQLLEKETLLPDLKDLALKLYCHAILLLPLPLSDQTELTTPPRPASADLPPFENENLGWQFQAFLFALRA